MSGVTTSTATPTSNVFTTSKCDKKNTKSSTSTFSRVSGFFSSAKNTSTQQSSKPSTSKPSSSSFGEPFSSKEKYKTYKDLEGNTNVKIDRGLLSGVKKVPGGFAIESKGSYLTFKGSRNITIGNSTVVRNVKQSSGFSIGEEKKSGQQSPYSSASSYSVPSSSKEKARSYSNFEEAAKKEKGVKIEKKGRSTNVTISGVSGLHIGKTETHTFPSTKDKSS